MTETAQEVQEEAKETTRKEIDRKQLDQEGDVAADYLEGLLDICDLDGDIDIEVDASRARVSFWRCECRGRN